MCAVLLLTVCRAHAAAAEKQKLTVFHAGSLSVPFREVSAEFEKRNPDVRVEAEAAGSRDTARKISDLGRSCEVMGSADRETIKELLMPKYADFNISFATNELAIAYTAKSRHQKELTSKNWHRILLRKDVAFGRADPNRDPCGYRTVMAFQLAEKYYKIPGLAARLMAKGGQRYIRPKETDLLALLESGEIDYLFIYRSVIIQHDLRLLRLPKEINLGSTAMAAFYRQAHVEVTGKTPGEMVKLVGAPIVYGVTIPKNAGNRKLAESWVGFLLSKEGQAIMERNGQSAIAPARAAGFNRLPASLKGLCVPEPAH